MTFLKIFNMANNLVFSSLNKLDANVIVGDFHYVWEPIAKILGLTFELKTSEEEDLLIFKK